jgi:2-methylcitrate dehydratase PrpD
MGQNIEHLARFAATTTLDDIPAPVRDHAMTTLMDTFAVILAGTARPEVQALRTQLTAEAGPATAYGIGWAKTDARSAALVNGIAGRSVELCEGLRLVSGQAAAQVLPGLLTIAETQDLPMRDLLTAFIIGYDVAARLCHAFTPWPLAHQNGQACLLAAIAGAARLQGFDAAGISLAMRIGTTIVNTPSYTNVVAGATALNLPGGMSGFAAALVPDLVRAGFTAQPDAIEEALANLVGQRFNADHLLDGLGHDWHIMRNYFRLYACCNPIHPALDALAATLGDLSPAPEQVARIDITTYRFASVMRNPEPPNFFASKYSLPHAAATMVVTGGAGHAQLDDAALTNPSIAGLRGLVHIQEDPDMTAATPVLRPARVTLTLTDGRQSTQSVDSHRGDFNNPFTGQELSVKFHQLAGTVLTQEGTHAIEAGFRRLDPIRAIVGLMRAHTRPAT